MNKNSKFIEKFMYKILLVSVLCLSSVALPTDESSKVTQTQNATLSEIKSHESMGDQNKTDDVSSIMTLEHLLAHLHSFQADFVQKISSKADQEAEEVSGVISIQKPGKFRWEVKQPYEQLLIADGTALWQYDVDLEQVVVHSIDESMGVTPVQLLSGHMTNLYENFSIESHETENNGVKIEIFHLLPKDDSQFQYVDLSFAHNDLLSLTLLDSLDQKTEVFFKNAKTNMMIDAKQFIFKLPDGVELVDSREAVDTDNTSSDNSVETSNPAP